MRIMIVLMRMNPWKSKITKIWTLIGMILVMAIVGTFKRISKFLKAIILLKTPGKHLHETLLGATERKVLILN